MRLRSTILAASLCLMFLLSPVHAFAAGPAHGPAHPNRTLSKVEGFCLWYGGFMQSVLSERQQGKSFLAMIQTVRRHNLSPNEQRQFEDSIKWAYSVTWSPGFYTHLAPYPRDIRDASERRCLQAQGFPTFRPEELW